MSSGGIKHPSPRVSFLLPYRHPKAKREEEKNQRNLDKYSTGACLRANTETSFISTKVSENNWHISGEKFKKSRTPTRMKSNRFVMSHCGNPQVLINTHHYFSSCCLLRWFCGRQLYDNWVILRKWATLMSVEYLKFMALFCFNSDE